jgi:maltose O-acetyltransferase
MRLLAYIYRLLYRSHIKLRDKELRVKHNIAKEVKLNYPENIFLHGNIIIGKYTYINGARIISGPNSKVQIGEWCAIGHNVNIIAWTHHPEFATGDERKRPSIEKDIIIGNNVWIGTNVFIKEGIRIGDNSSIGANSVVTKDIEPNSIVAGAPAKLIRKKQLI